MFNSNLDQWYEHNTGFVQKLHSRYPTKKDELVKYLTKSHENHVLSGSNYNEWKDLPMDLDSQLKLEFALYLINERLQSSGINRLKASVFLQKMGNADSDALKELVHLVVENGTPRAAQSATDGDDKVEQITSYLISSAISKGINLAPVEDTSNIASSDDDELAFCKKTISNLINAFPESSSSKKDESAPQTVDVKSSPDTSTFETDTKDMPTKEEDLNTAIKDLQLAYKFLKSQYENDRTEYLSTIENLNKTNRELSEELLHYHSKLKESKEKPKAVAKKKPESLELHGSFSPIFSDFQDIKSPGSSSNNHQSFSMMKQEFKRVLADTQQRYEKELQQERELRMQLEQELEQHTADRSIY